MLILIAGIICAVLTALFFSTLTYALRDFSRSRLEDALAAQNRSDWLGSVVDHRDDLTLITAIGRLLANTCILLIALHIFDAQTRFWLQYLYAGLLALLLSGIFSIMLPLSLAEYAGESVIALSIRFLTGVRLALFPVTRLMAAMHRVVRAVTGGSNQPEPEEIEKDILSVVEEGEKEGVVDRQERRMIESVIEFRDTTVDQTMTARPEIVAIELGATLDEVKRSIEESGHSRLPVYDGTLDHIVGILYARDLLKHLGEPPEQFEIRSAMRPAVFVPEGKPLRDLLLEFRLQKVHIAIVMDEYGGTAGLVTIEDILEELVGEISDEHEPQAPPPFKRLDDLSFEVDARVYIDEFNRQTGLTLPEDGGYDTLGGYVSNALGHIPQAGTVFEQNGARFTVLEAEPQRVKRMKVEPLPAVVPSGGDNAGA